jgi:DNA-directed RNA polymerase specialized sigma24 family protein
VLQAAAYIVALPATPPLGAEIDAPTLEACRCGEPAALRAFVARYERPVFAYVSRVLAQRGPLVEDLAQEVFLRAIRARCPRRRSAAARACRRGS